MGKPWSVLLWVAGGLVLANATFAAVTGFIWPGHLPAWAARVLSIGFLLPLLVVAIAVFGWRRGGYKK